ncbi:LytR C-terminal domain-containing protein [Massilia glaciei]|uniref:Tetratricopeptide repeat protein n=1 Tax=Massilia glaciei TaxID=1524097 RepID=A0A2U2I622_9BURK|nr:LytR C-terminal domain-containing protein [Massilia glaciei]PWF55196.1 tetratricopeptide repeat protein [Massilia glaciei]
MRTTLKRLSVIGAGAMLLACADLGRRLPQNAAHAPDQGARLSADDAYVLGRQHHIAGRAAPAARYYQAALASGPGHVNARNGLATLLAERGEFRQAIAIWQALTADTARASGAGAAFLFSNLGYAHLLSGDYEPALTALEKACVLDPLNARAWRHMGGALAKLGQGGRAELMYKQARALEKHDFKADIRAVGPRAGAVAAGPGEGRAGQHWASTELRQTSAGVFELHRVGAGSGAAAMPATSAARVDLLPPVAALVPAAASAASAARDGARHTLEIRNGNGVTGMARALGRRIDGAEVRVVRLSNHPGYGVRKTRVEYQSGLREAARQLAGRFGPAALVEVDGERRADMRLVIGRDRMPGKLARKKAEEVAELVAKMDSPR